MVNYRLISKDVKERVLWLIDHQYAPDDICEIFGISARSIRRWKANYRIHGSVAPPPTLLRGQPRILNADMTHDLNTLLLEAPELYLDEIQDWLAVSYQHCVSKSTLFRHIRDAGMTFKLLRRAAAERDDELRQDWMNDVNTHFVASQMIFVDESSKDDRTIYRHYGRSPAGQRAVISANFVRGDRFSIVAGLSLDGYEAMRVVPGSVDSETFLDFIVHDVVCIHHGYDIQWLMEVR